MEYGTPFQARSRLILFVLDQEIFDLDDARIIFSRRLAEPRGFVGTNWTCLPLAEIPSRGDRAELHI